MKGISILGSTGSIGCNTLKVIEHLGDFRVVALGAGRNMAKLAEQIASFKPELVSVDDELCAETLLDEPFTGQLRSDWTFTDGTAAWSIAREGMPLLDLSQLLNVVLSLDYRYQMNVSDTHVDTIKPV